MNPSKRLFTLIILPILLSALMLLFSKLLQPPQNLRPKIFILGLSKTGTTSLGNALSKLGYRRFGWHDIRSRHLVHSYAHNNLAPLYEITKYYDAFEDLPWPGVYKELVEWYPDAKFVLSVRRDEEVWGRSMRGHMERGRWGGYKHFFGGVDVWEGNEGRIKGAYGGHNQGVREFFRDKPGRMVEICIDDEGRGSWERLCEVADCPEGWVEDGVRFPRSNSKEEWREGGVLGVLGWWWGWVVTRGEEWAVRVYYDVGTHEGIRWLMRACWRIFDTVETVVMRVYLEVLARTSSAKALRWSEERRG